MNSDLLDLPLGVKIHVKPGSEPLFCRGKLGEELRVPCLYFTLDDPYNHHNLNIAYNCLHDPHLLDYHTRKDVLKLLKRQGFVTSDNKVLCTLKEFNEYRHYLTRLKLRAEYMSRRPEEWVHPPPLKSKHGLRLPGAFNTEQWLKARKSSSPHPHKRRETTVTLGQEDASLPGRVSTDAGSQRKADAAADRWVRAVLEQLSPAEAQKLQDLALAVVLRVFGRLKVPRDQRVSFLRRAAEGIRRSSGSCMRSEPSGTSRDCHQNLEALAQELVATVLDMLGNHLESRISEAGSAARQEELPADGGVTQAERSKAAETAAFHRARLEACLDKLTKLVIRNVQKLLKSMVASQFEGDSSSEDTETLELHSSHLSQGQPQPRRTHFSKQGREARRGFPRASEASTGGKLPLLQQKCPAGRTSYAPTLESEVLETVEETMEEEKSVTTSGCPSDLRSMAKQISRSTIQRIFQCGPAPTPEEDFSAPTDEATSRGGRQSCATEDTLPSVGRRCCCQPVPPGRPKPPAQARAQHRAVHPKPL